MEENISTLAMKLNQHSFAGLPAFPQTLSHLVHMRPGRLSRFQSHQPTMTTTNPL